MKYSMFITNMSNMHRLPYTETITAALVYIIGTFSFLSCKISY